MFGKAFISFGYSVVFVYASEIFPTEVRNIAVGTAAMCARISSMAASYVGGPLVSGQLSLQRLKQAQNHGSRTKYH